MLKIYKLQRSKKRQITILIALLFLSSMFYYSISYGYKNGITGKTNNGCTCHGSQNSNTIMSPSSQSGLWTVMAGSQNTFSVTVANSNKSHAGVNIAVKTASDGNTDAGSLSPVSGYALQASNSELTHTNAKPYSSSAEYKFTWTAPTTPGTYYLKAVGNAVDSNNQSSNDQWNYMTPKAIVVQAAPTVTLTAPNGGEGLCPGSTKNITWTYETINNVMIELSTNAGSSFDVVLVASTPAAANSWSWSIPSNQQVANTYRIRISDASNSSVFDVSDNNFSVSGGAQITQQPQSLAACTGKQAQFSVTATGSGLTYQWRKNGQNIQNTNSAIFLISPVESQSAGSYDCVVSGSCGSPVTTTSANLTVDISPSITSQPTSKTICIDQPASFSVTAAGTDITYQWKKNGVNIADQTSSTLSFANVQPTDAGNYVCLVSGKCEPTLASQQVTLTVPTLPEITVEPKSDAVCEGGKLILFAKVNGSNLTYSWWRNNSELPNSNNDTLVIDNASQADAGTYFLKVSTDCDLSASSAQATVFITPKPFIVKDPSALVVSKGQKAVFTVTTQGDKLIYQWMKDGKNIQDANQATYTIASASVSDNGLYTCKVSNNCGELISKQAQLTVQETASAVLNFSNNPLFVGKVESGKSRNFPMENAFSNLGELALTINSIDVTGADATDFQIVNLSLPLTLQQNEKNHLTIKFNPKTSGPKNAILKFNSNSIGNGELALSALGVDLKPEISKTELVFNFSAIGNVIEQEFSIINSSNTELNGKLSITGTGASSFKVKSQENFLIKLKDSYLGKIAFEALTNSNAEAVLKIEFPEFDYSSSIPMKSNNLNSVEDELLNISIEVLPNPSSNGINIQLNNIANHFVNAVIFDANGLAVRELKAENSGMNTNLHWDLRDNSGNSVANGVYSALIFINDKTYKKQLLIYK
jgi:hypothetical protein